MMKWTKLTPLIWVFTISAHAQDRVGNGGDVIVCPQSVELLDFYETDQSLKAFDPQADHKRILEAVLKNLSRLNPKQARQYQKRVDGFFGEAEFKKDVALTDIKDSKHVFTPAQKGCELKQIAIRRAQETTRGKRFVIDDALWKRLSERGRAGLILHEVIYEHLFKLNENDSVRARELNAYIFSEKAFKDAPENYWQIIKTLKLPIYK